MAKRGKRYRAQLALFSRTTSYPLPEAIKLLQQMPHAKFDETVNLAFRLGVDPRQSDQNVRGAIALPHGTGKKVRVCVIAQGDAAEAARGAGADVVGADDLIEKIKTENWMDFDIMVATPSSMSKLRALGKILGPRGLMPNPKTGTVTEDTATAVKAAKAGRVEYRTDKAGCVHVMVGKLSFPAANLVENCLTVGQALVRARPASAKGTYLLSCTLSSTMSPGVKVGAQEFATRSETE